MSIIDSNSASFDSYSLEPGRLSRRLLSRTIPGAIALVLSAAAGAWIVHSLPIGTSGDAKAPAPAPKMAVAAAPTAAPSPYGVLFDPGFSSEMSPASLGRDFSVGSQLKPIVRPPVAAPIQPQPESATAAPLESTPLPPPRPVMSETAETAPLPPPRPAGLATRSLEVAALPTEREALPADKPAPVSAPPAVRRPNEPVAAVVPPPPPAPSLFGRLFGWTQSPSVNISSRYDKFTAVYDVSAHVVYLPDGTRLEAHSGLGDKLDDTRSFAERMRGPTPPHLYDLAPREELFHGVQALRLTPVGGGDMFGRAGLLAHSYMLGPNGDSNGCVSFRDYQAFLQAYQNGQVKHLAVVASLN